MKSKRASSAQWMSSNTSTVGPSSASASKKRRHAANASTRPLSPLAETVSLQPDQGPQVPEHPLAIPLVQDQRRDRLRKLRIGDLRRVGFQDAGLRLDHLAQRPERDALPVGQRAATPPRDQLRQLLDVPQQLLDQSGLADPRLTDDRHQLRRRLPPRPIQRATQHVGLRVAADQRQAADPHLLGHDRPRRDRHPRLDRLRLALRLHRLRRLVADRPLGRPIRPPIHQDTAQRRRRLQPRRRVHDIADRIHATRRVMTDQRLTTRHAHPHPQVGVACLGHSLTDPERRRGPPAPDHPHAPWPRRRSPSPRHP